MLKPLRSPGRRKSDGDPLPARPRRSSGCTAAATGADSARIGDAWRRLGLTAREAEVVIYVISGESNGAIADRLHVSAGTVKKHLDNIYRKLGVRGRGHLTAFVLDIVQR